MPFVGSSIIAADSSVQFFAEFDGVTIPGTTQSLISFTVPASTTRRVHKLIVSCRQNGAFELKAGASVIASGRTGPSEMNAEFSFSPIRDITTGTSVVLEFTGASGRPASDLEAYFMGSDI